MVIDVCTKGMRNINGSIRGTRINNDNLIHGTFNARKALCQKFLLVFNDHARRDRRPIIVACCMTFFIYHRLLPDGIHLQDAGSFKASADQ